METTAIEQFLASLEQPKYSYKLCGIFKTPVRITSDQDTSDDD